MNVNVDVITISEPRPEARRRRGCPRQYAASPQHQFVGSRWRWTATPRAVDVWIVCLTLGAPDDGGVQCFSMTRHNGYTYATHWAQCTTNEYARTAAYQLRACIDCGLALISGPITGVRNPFSIVQVICESEKGTPPLVPASDGTWTLRARGHGRWLSAMPRPPAAGQHADRVEVSSNGCAPSLRPSKH